MTEERGSITRWSRLAAGFALAAIAAPEGMFRWTALALAVVALVMAAARVPRQSWSAHVVLLASLGSAVAAIWIVEFFPLGEAVTRPILGITAGFLGGAILLGAVRTFRPRANKPDVK